VARSPHPAPRSDLIGRRWRIDVLELELECIHASASVLRSIDADWVARRKAGAANAHWRWYNIALSMPERFALRDDAADPVGVWSSGTKRPIELDGEPYYRLDYPETDPWRRGGGIGLFTLAVVAARARELSAEGIVLGGLDTRAAKALYSSARASNATPGGWRPSKGLIPYCIVGDAFAGLCEYADAHQEPQDES